MCLRQRRPADRRFAADVQRGHRLVELVRPETAALSSALARAHDHVRQILRAGVDAADPAHLLQDALRTTDPALCSPFLVAAGKAAWQMFEAAAAALPVRRAVVTGRPDGHRIQGGVRLFDAGHPAPNAASVDAGEEALRLARESGGSGLTVLLSGGASAMLAAPVDGVTLEEKIATARALMEAGAPIHELNCVRKHLSRIKGGGLAAAAGRTLTFALSDVHGPIPDDPAVIGSGPTVGDRSTYADALEVIQRRGASAPRSVVAHLDRGARGEAPETVKPDDPRLRRSVYRVIGNRLTALEGARRAAEGLGYRVHSCAEATAGEARDAATAFLREAPTGAGSASGPLCVLATGETTVTVRGSGRGGRNQEFALAGALELHRLEGQERKRLPGIVVLGSAGTDGIDGPTDAAGAVVDATTVGRAAALGLDARAALAANDAYGFFEPLGNLITWGPTGTNVGDLHVLLIV